MQSCATDLVEVEKQKKSIELIRDRIQNSILRSRFREQNKISVSSTQSVCSGTRKVLSQKVKRKELIRKSKQQRKRRE